MHNEYTLSLATVIAEAGKLLTSGEHPLSDNVLLLIENDVPLEYVIRQHPETGRVRHNYWAKYGPCEVVDIIDADSTSSINTIITNYYQPITSNTTHICLTDNKRVNVPQSSYRSGVDNICDKKYELRSATFFDEDSLIELPDFVCERFGASMRIPNKIVKTITDHCQLSRITHTFRCTKTEALEVCLVVLSMLRFHKIDPDNDEYSSWTQIHSDKFMNVLGNKYRTVISVLEKGTDNGPIIECDGEAEIDKKAYSYRMAERYEGVGWQVYSLKTDMGKEYYLKSIYKKLSKLFTNGICQRVVATYPNVTLPTIAQVRSHGKTLIKKGYKTNKGKWLVSLNRKSLDVRMPQLQKRYGKIDDESEFSFLETAIDQFKYLTTGGYLIPTEGGINSGGRVVDSFTLMPSWIRDMILIKGKRTTPFDYKALHPNIALKLYGSEEELETLGGDVHGKLAERFGIDRERIKIAHLSFFNLPVNRKHYPKQKKGKRYIMQDSFLWDYYMEVAPVMMQRLYEDKMRDYKQTSQRLFTLEVEMMSEVVSRLDQGVDVLYVYDALYAIDDVVGSIMNEVAKEFGVPTYVEIEN